MRGSHVNPPRVLMQSLGCKTNQYENDALAAAFIAAGFLLAEDGLPVDVAVLNTCTVTGEAGRKSRQMLRRLRERHPGAIIVASGCHAQLADLSALADLTVGTSGRDRIVEEVVLQLETRPDGPRVFLHEPCAYETIAPVSLPSETRAYVKIEDGCDNRCTYCAIRLARGRARSRPAGAIVAEIDALARAGHREIVLTGTHIGSYGKGEDTSLIDLLEQIDETSAERVRLGSLEPAALSEAFIERAARLKRLCPHFHLSLQSGSDGVLHRMNRRYTAADYRTAVARILRVWPQAGLTTDVMVGFPGETEAEHRESVDFIRELPFTDLHIFRFSARGGTPAAAMPAQVPADISKSRSRDMEQLAEVKRTEAVGARIGERRTVIVEKTENGRHFGYTEDYLYVSLPALSADLAAGSSLDVIVTGREEGQATAKAVLHP